MKDLIKLYSFYSVHKTEDEKAICDWICGKLTALKVPHQRIGNTIYSFTKDNTVMLSAHLDQVATNGKAVHFYKKDGFILAYNDRWQRTSLGGDDKNGVWIILKMLEKGYKFDFIISEGEEVGCVGIKKVEPFLPLSTAEICLVLDRKGHGDILNKGGTTNYCDALATNLKNYLQNGYQVTTGTVSDTQTICRFIESVNMSVAYYNPHLSSEYTDFTRLEEIASDIEYVLSGDFTHYPASPEDYTPQVVTYNYNYNKNKSKLSVDDDDYYDQLFGKGGY